MSELEQAILFYADHPVEFVEDIIGATPDEEQAKILRSLAANTMTSVRSGHGVGKSTVEAWAVIWFMATRPFPKIPCTAPTQHQLFDILWAEVSKWLRHSKPLANELVWTKEKVYMRGYPEEWFAVARTASKPDALQGFHAEHVLYIIDEASETMLKITEFVMAFSPIGIASLMATMVSTISSATMKEVISFLITDNICAVLILFVLYPLLIQLFAKLNGVRFMKKITEPMLVAISTTSSAATLPVSIRTAEEKLGVPENIYGFTLPLGNTCGMNGFALFIGLFCVFSSHLYGFDISFGRIAQFVFLGIILSIGAAGVKGAGVVMSTVLLEALGMPLSMVPILAAIWPTIDPAHTVLNNVSDLTGTTIIASQLGRLDKAVFDSSAKGKEAK